MVNKEKALHGLIHSYCMDAGKRVRVSGKFMIERSELILNDDPCLIKESGYGQLVLAPDYKFKCLAEWQNCIIVTDDTQDQITEIRLETDDEKARRVAIDAEFAFWEVVMKHYPDVNSDGWMCDLQSEENVLRWLQSEAGGE